MHLQFLGMGVALMKRNLGIVGHGRIGSALGQVFTDNGWHIDYFDPDPNKRTVESLKELAQKSKFIIIAAPSYANRSIAADLLPYVRGKLIATVAKGVEPGFITMHEVLDEVGENQFEHAILYGPMLAAEIAEQKPGTIMVATNNPAWSADFNGSSQIKFIYNDDPYSVALCGVLKNIYAIALGLNDGLELGNNSKGALTVRIIDEFERLLNELGGDSSLVLSVVGIGDLLATGWSDKSFNYTMGKNFASDAVHSEAKGEGALALKEIKAKINLHDYPIIETLYKIMYKHARPTALNKIM
jgi:glycerol-3-phosphate dehydrogenase (NAD(P)+)